MERICAQGTNSFLLEWNINDKGGKTIFDSGAIPASVSIPLKSLQAIHMLFK